MWGRGPPMTYISEDILFAMKALRNAYDIPNLTPSQKTALRRKIVAKRSGASKEAAKELLLAKAEKTLDRDELDSYFESVATKMRRMNEEQRLFAEKIIIESVFLGMFNRLTEFSHENNPTMTFPHHNQGYQIHRIKMKWQDNDDDLEDFDERADVAMEWME
uniref:Uncharacterized protein n=1 Tax=Timema poppense TaxID=170557 RepID=A0A7R9HBL6_TIMPO|nr:unnamed protein product [Timema poppensis]